MSASSVSGIKPGVDEAAVVDKTIGTTVKPLAVREARAIIKKPELLFADEPTGNLDFENTQQITSLLTSLNSKGLTIVLVTHNLEMANTYSHRVIKMQYGKVIEGSSQVTGGITQ